MKFTRSSRRLASPFEEDVSDSEVDIGRLESQFVVPVSNLSILLTSYRQFLAMTKTMAKQKASKQADTHKAEFQKMVEASKQKAVGALKENVLDM